MIPYLFTALSRPDVALGRVMEIVLREQFQPSDEPEKVFVLKRFLNPEWLPKIRNIEFVLIGDNELKERGKAYFLKKAPYWEKGFLRVDFGFGDPECSATGSSWFFTIKGDEVHQIMDQGGGWGMACATSDVPPPAKKD